MRIFKHSRGVRRFALGAFVCLVMGASTSAAFPYVAQPGDTLAALAKRLYGRMQNERIISTANSLDGSKTRGLTPGMILEIPALSYHQVQEGETWKSLASEHLGSDKRGILLAQVNGHKPWVQPELGQLIALPYNLSWIASGEESLATLAYRFLGSTKYAYRLVQYNDLGDRDLERGNVLLLPLSELPLTDEGRRAAENAAAQLSHQARGAHFEKQRASHAETVKLSEDIRGGRYISAVARGTELLSAGRLSRPGSAKVHRALLEAYVALDARGLARASCDSLLSLAPETRFDALTNSPKILRLCDPEKRSAPSPSEKEDPSKDERKEPKN